MVNSVQISCDAAIARATAFSAAPMHPALALAAAMAAGSLVYIDGAVMAIGLPAIGRGLILQGSQSQWVINAYLLPLTALSLLGGAWGDRFGRRRALILGAAIFALSSAAASLAPTASVLLGLRFLQGIGAALLVPNSLAILGQMFSGENEARAVGLWSATAAIASAIGPVLGGWLIDIGHWHLIFLLSAPVAALSIVLAIRYVPVDREITSRPLDLSGGALAALALAALTWSLTTTTTSPERQAEALATAALALVVLGGFIWVQRELGERAMVPLYLFSSRNLTGITLFSLLLYGAFNAFLILIPFVLLKAAGYSGAAAGAIFVPLQIVFTVVSPLMARVVARVGPRVPLGMGALISACGFLLATRIGTQTDYWSDVFPAVLLLSVGMSSAVAPLTTLVLTSVDGPHTSTASGINSTATRLGALITTALLGTVLIRRGEHLFAAFSTVMVVGAVVCLLAAISVIMIEGAPRFGLRETPSGP
jgi:EmrB/QacA subfamily drug resistance transporter